MDVSALNLEELDENQLEPYFREAIVIFDSSALLEIYSYPKETRRQLYENIFNLFEDRLWLPSHVIYEYRKNKRYVITKPISSYKSLTHPSTNKSDDGYVSKINSKVREIDKDIIKYIDGQFQSLVEFTKSPDKHPFIEYNIHDKFKNVLNRFRDEVSNLKEGLKVYIEELEHFKEIQEAAINETLKDDDLEKYIIDKFVAGEKFSFEQLIAIAAEGRFRYEEKIPPGYEDKTKKIGLQKYGDLIIWKEILSYAKKNEKDIIFITNDSKDDWWEFEKKTKSTVPRYELLKEFSDVTNRSILMYRPDKFYYLAKKTLNAGITEGALETISESQLHSNRSVRADRVESVLLSWLIENTNISINATEERIGDTNLRVDFTGTNESDKVLFGEFKFLNNGTKSAIFSTSARVIEYFKALIATIEYPIDFLFVYAFRNEAEAKKAKVIIKDYLVDDSSIDFVNDSLFYLVIGYLSEGKFILEFSDYPNLLKT